MSKKRTSNPPTESVSEALRQVYSSRTPQSDLKQEIMATVHSIVRERGWTITDFHWQSYPLSFHWVELVGDEGPLSLLIEEGAPIAALCRSVPPIGEKLPFFDDPDFARVAAEFHAPFTVMRAAELAKDLTAADRKFVARLSVQHADDLRYWKPETVGDVVFNFWD